MVYCRVPSGELLEVVVKENNLTEAVAVSYLSQLLLAVDTLHKLKVAHLDIRVSHMTRWSSRAGEYHVSSHMIGLIQLTDGSAQSSGCLQFARLAYGNDSLQLLRVFSHAPVSHILS